MEVVTHDFKKVYKRWQKGTSADGYSDYPLVKWTAKNAVSRAERAITNDL